MFDFYFFFFKQKTAYEMRISDWSSNVCSSDLPRQYAAGVSYDFEVVKLAAAYARTTDGWFTGQDLPSGTPFSNEFGSNRFVDGFKANAYMVGGTVPIGGASSVFASWQRVDPSNDRLTDQKSTRLNSSH